MPTTKTVVPSSGISPCAGSHVLAQQSQKQRNKSLLQVILAQHDLLNLATSSRIMHHSELFSSSPQHSAQISKARALSFGRKTSEIEIQCRLRSVSSSESKGDYQTQKDHLHSQYCDRRYRFSDTSGPRQPNSKVSREG